MDKDRIQGKAEDIAGKVKRKVGEVTGNHELEAEGALEQAKGKTRNAVGQVKDTVRDAADNIKSQIAIVGHHGCTGDRGTERAHNRQEPRQNNRLAAVALVEFVRPIEMLSLEKPRIFSLIESLPGSPPDQIPNLIPGNGAQGHKREQPSQLQVPRAGKYARRHQQGISRQEKAYKKAGFGEHDGAHHRGPTPFNKSPNIIQLREDMTHESCHPKVPVIARFTGEPRLQPCFYDSRKLARRQCLEKRVRTTSTFIPAILAACTIYGSGRARHNGRVGAVHFEFRGHGIEGGYAVWMGQPVVLRVVTGNLRVPLRGRLMSETNDVVRLRIADSWDVDIFKSMVVAVEHDNPVYVVN